jgi:hypothetical protein
MSVDKMRNYFSEKVSFLQIFSNDFMIKKKNTTKYVTSRKLIKAEFERLLSIPLCFELRSEAKISSLREIVLFYIKNMFSPILTVGVIKISWLRFLNEIKLFKYLFLWKDLIFNSNSFFQDLLEAYSYHYTLSPDSFVLKLIEIRYFIKISEINFSQELAKIKNLSRQERYIIKKIINAYNENRGLVNLSISVQGLKDYYQIK